MRRKWIFMAPLAILAMLLFIAIGGEVVLQLWNWLLPPIFGWRQITFWQAVGILALCRILFGGFGGHGGYRSKFGRRMAERWEHMTPEERERVRQGMRGRCGFGPSTARARSNEAMLTAPKAMPIYRGLIGKVAVATGASSGIGAETARYLAANMVAVVVNSRNRDKLNKWLQALRSE